MFECRATQRRGKNRPSVIARTASNLARVSHVQVCGGRSLWRSMGRNRAAIRQDALGHAGLFRFFRISQRAPNFFPAAADFSSGETNKLECSGGSGADLGARLPLRPQYLASRALHGLRHHAVTLVAFTLCECVALYPDAMGERALGIPSWILSAACRDDGAALGGLRAKPNGEFRRHDRALSYQYLFDRQRLLLLVVMRATAVFSRGKRQSPRRGDRVGDLAWRRFRQCPHLFPRVQRAGTSSKPTRGAPGAGAGVSIYPRLFGQSIL